MSNDKKIPPQFIVRIAIRNQAGAVTGHKDFVTLPGLVTVAHSAGLESVETTLLQSPTDANGQTAIVRAVATGKAGTFSGLGDANPKNVNRKVAPHLLRVAESRAIARCLRLFGNVQAVALEELGEDDDLDVDHARPMTATNIISLPTSRDPRAERGARSDSITDAQRRALFRKALARGIEGDDAVTYITRRLGVAVERATKDQASKLLDELAREERVVGANGGGHAA